LTSIIVKRQSLHQLLAEIEQENAVLKSQNLQLQALANLGSATCMIAHEINNLLTPLSSYAALAVQNPDDHKLAEKALDKTVKNCRRAAKIMETLLSLANGSKQQPEQVPLRALVEDVFTGLCRDFTKDRIVIEVHVPGDLEVHCVPVQIQQVLMNLILNARDAMLGRGGTLRVTACHTDDDVQIEVSDTGDGISPENLKNIFRPFFTTKSGTDRPAGGSGVGLAFCRRVMDAHGGRIEVESQLGKGTTFRLRLPQP
jgi:signal transduction histidine kinase